MFHKWQKYFCNLIVISYGCVCVCVCVCVFVRVCVLRFKLAVVSPYCNHLY